MMQMRGGEAVNGGEHCLCCLCDRSCTFEHCGVTQFHSAPRSRSVHTFLPCVLMSNDVSQCCGISSLPSIPPSVPPSVPPSLPPSLPPA